MRIVRRERDYESDRSETTTGSRSVNRPILVCPYRHEGVNARLAVPLDEAHSGMILSRDLRLVGD
jgi:hypothetical protein